MPGATVETEKKVKQSKLVRGARWINPGSPMTAGWIIMSGGERESQLALHSAPLKRCLDHYVVQYWLLRSTIYVYSSIGEE